VRESRRVLTLLVQGYSPSDKERKAAPASGAAFLKGLIDRSAEAGERSERKPGVVTPRDGPS